MFAVGDIILGPDAEPFFTFVAPVLKTGDIVLGQLEVPYTTRDSDAVALGRDPENLSALISAGFNVVTLAGNHIWDAGAAGIEDTLAWLNKHDIAFTGGGMNINEARRPVVIERDGTRFGFMSYNCVGPKETWAAPRRPGCAYVHIITHYELEHATPGGPPTVYTWAESDTLGAMVDDIRSLRSLCDILVVSLHKGIGHTPVKLAVYEQQVSYAALDAGADLIVGHHAHILKGIELYRGKAIFHGLCNLVAYVPSLAPGTGQDPRSWARRRKELFGFEPDPEYPTYPFHPEARYTIITKCAVKDKKIFQTGYIPCLINKQGQPEILKRDARGQEVFEYMDKITRGAGLNAKFEWKGDEVIVQGG
jgi:poly-gamma-glutamate synthesis protein (capsule biosynthesis protein)